MRKLQRFNCYSDTLCNHCSRFYIRRRKDECKFLSSTSGNEISWPAYVADSLLSDFKQAFITCLVAIEIIIFLEMINIGNN